MGRIPMERTVEVREDPLEELAESNWPAKAGYGWAIDVRMQHMIFRWLQLLKSWLNCTPIFEKGAQRDIVVPERVTTVECVCHNRDGAAEEFLYIPWRYKGMAREELSVADREVVDAVIIFSNKMPTKGLVRMGKKNLTLFQTLRKEKAARAKAVGDTEVPNLQESLVDVHVHGGTKRKAELLARPGPEAGLIELPETVVQRDIEINMLETLINSIDNMDPNHLVKTMVEFSSKALLLGHRVGSLYRRELKEGNREKLQELQEKGRIADLEAGYDEMKEKHDGLEVELDDLKSYVIQEHIKGFQKGLRQASFFYKDMDAGDVRFDVNKDVVDSVLVDEVESSPREDVGKVVEVEKVDANPDDAGKRKMSNRGWLRIGV
ncbi:hypothetical protein DEO72_LG2g1763 [Vigna unguiculata]|uniref:Uncharacterized protein n=1 Tax=Vigna unguiculata TaxID=3917 RepID=A0A4D6KYM8_VIGUN|nr:hypothetical protein DEO72_LG2g1763 [Vigna unguiculata]